MGIVEVRRKLSELAKANRALLDSDEFDFDSDECNDAYDKNMSEIRSLLKRLSLLEQQEEIESVLDVEVESVAQQQLTRDMRPRVVVTDPEDRDINLRFGLWLQSVRRASLGQGVDTRLAASLDEQRAILGANATVGAEGGFLLTRDFSSVLIQRVYETGAILSRITQLPPLSPNADGIELPAVAESSRATGSRYGGVRAYWIKEGDAPPASKPKIETTSLRFNTIAALGYSSQKLLKHVAAFGAFMMNLFTKELAFVLEDALIRGTGVGEPLGVLNSSALVTVAKEAGQAANTVVVNNVVKMYSRMPSSLRPGAVWLVNQDVEPEFLSFTIGNQPVYLPAGGLSQKPYGVLFGSPVIPVEYCTTLGSEGDIIYLNPGEIYGISSGTPQGDQSIHVAFTTFQEAFRISMEFDARPIWKSALTPYQGTNSLSPYVDLAVRA